ncbi:MULTISPECIES: hypothetical protein [unclassified Novosphingobium]|uniref:hypothetical protein n=1 Tax=unclassified Novosphingobium TaxID=2644732 RepID=UPI000D317C3D|nr:MULTISPECIES: hypothetical protein [unclassified Novosphingobium]PTR05387.1 hypothetical protein C8K11_13414 [Novosphingobium sp. GV055]PUA93951.1 hypothetical protein C8K12_13414 [Novosphingobium sp. GV061]PUB11368.1 hypothetical protein C8K14_13414 [Novosphingobium sp. GV079]PUB37058.1 hypothetical protein C8K10_13414 [Novosphingobium sp. GV027]
MAQGPIPMLPALAAPAEILDTARLNCAARAQDRDQADLAVSFLEGGQDCGWSMRHEVAKLLAESAKGGAA